MSLKSVEITIFNGSPFIGKTLGEIVKKYAINIPHYHNPTLSPENRTSYSPNIPIKEFYAINCVGSSDSLYKLLEDSM